LNSMSIKGKGLVLGKRKGGALVSQKVFTFAHGVDPATGRVTDVRSDIRGSNVRGTVLFYPFGKGSTTASSWFLETVRSRNHPAAIVTERDDLSAVAGSVLARLVYGKEMPVVSGVSRTLYSQIRQDAEVFVDADQGEVRTTE
jgi:predicted aconitase with swiveling domain